MFQSESEPSPIHPVQSAPLILLAIYLHTCRAYLECGSSGARDTHVEAVRGAHGERTRYEIRPRCRFSLPWNGVVSTDCGYSGLVKAALSESGSVCVIVGRGGPSQSGRLGECCIESDRYCCRTPKSASPNATHSVHAISRRQRVVPVGLSLTSVLSDLQTYRASVWLWGMELH